MMDARGVVISNSPYVIRLKLQQADQELTRRHLQELPRFLPPIVTSKALALRKMGLGVNLCLPSHKRQIDSH